MSSFLSYGKQSIAKEDIGAALGVRESDFLTQERWVQLFEDKPCSNIDTKYCVAIANSTVAIHVAVAAVKINEVSEGATLPKIFSACAGCTCYSGITPHFTNTRSQTHNIDRFNALAFLQRCQTLVMGYRNCVVTVVDTICLKILLIGVTI